MLIAAVDVKLERILATYREKLKVTFPIIDDSKFTLARKFGIGFTPATVIVDKDGKVEDWFAGYTEENKDEILATFDKYVARSKASELHDPGGFPGERWGGPDRPAFFLL